MTPRLAPRSPDLVWFRGPDTIRFLNDIISQEIADLDPGRVVRSLLLAPQGKLDHILWALRGDQETGLLTDPGRGGQLVAALSRYRIRVDVEIAEEERPAWLVVGEWEPAPGPGEWVEADDALMADVSWPGAQRTLLVGDRPHLDTMPEGEYERARIEAGEPAWGTDVDQDTIPHESGLVPATVDFTKGCFLGQELVARIDSRGGNVPRRVQVVELEQGTAPIGATVTSEGRDVGRLTSVSGRVALAVLKRGVEPGDEIAVDGLRGRVRALPQSRVT